jgi:hypothetical protein
MSGEPLAMYLLRARAEWFAPSPRANSYLGSALAKSKPTEYSSERHLKFLKSLPRKRARRQNPLNGPNPQVPTSYGPILGWMPFESY